jgi:integrase
MPKLTAAALARIRATSERQEIPDSASSCGLRLVIQPSGHRSWAMRFRRPNGKPAKLTLGPLAISGDEMEGDPAIGAPLTLAAARRLAEKINHERALGRDVTAEKHRARLERKVHIAANFEQAARDFVRQHAIRKTRRWQATARVLGLSPHDLELIPNGLAARWRDVPIADVDGDLVHAVIDEAREKGIPGLERHVDGPSESRARAMFTALRTMFTFLLERRRVKANPCLGVASPEAAKARDRVLTNEEIAKLWAAIETLSKPFRLSIRLLLATGARLDEVASMRVGELSSDSLVWSLPGERTKNHLPHIVPLSSLARGILSQADRIVGSEFVFSTNGKVAVAGFGKTKAQLDKTLKIPPWVLHDLRRTCATGMAEIGIPPHIVEACLNHVSGAKAGVAGTYNRAAYAEAKKAAFEAWGQHIERLVSGRREDKVVPIRRRGKR